MSYQEKFNLKLSLIIGIGLWLFALIYAMIIMGILGVNPQTDTDWGINHEKYWSFEIIMIPTFILISVLVLYIFFKKYGKTQQEWLVEGLLTGVVIMVVQFIMDFLVLILLFGNGLDYFAAMVTISYLLIPVWTISVRWLSLNH